MTDPIVYASPKVFTMNALMNRLENLLAIGLFVFLLVWGGNSTALNVTLVVAIVVTLLFHFGAIRPHLMRRIELYEDSFWIGGLDRGCRVDYDDVALIQSFSSISYADLAISDHNGMTFGLPLRKKDADECLKYLHELCGAAASVDANDRAQVPENPENVAAGQELLGAVFRQRAKHARLACILGMVVWTAALIVGLSNSPNWPATPTTWGFVIALPPLVAIGLVIWRRSLSKANSFERDLVSNGSFTQSTSDQIRP